jgi:hypothetical protein
MAGSRVTAALAAVLITAAGAGAAVRILKGNSLLQTDLVYSPARKERFPGTKDPESTARSFYMYLDDGLYEKAYDISLEPARSGGDGPGGGAYSGWTSRDDFVARMNRELGSGGSGIRLGNIRAGKAEPIAVEECGFGASNPTPGATHLASVAPPEGAYRVKVSGHMLGACSVFRWGKNVTVLKTGGQYRVLLDELPGEGNLSYRSWFENVEKVADLRGGVE